jgi:putative hemolysin
MRIFFFLFKPIITLLNASSNGLLRLIGIAESTDAELAHTEEELRLILAHDTHVSATTRNIALNAMDFHKKQARHSMIPRKEIVALSLHAPVQDTIGIMLANKYSRFPVYKDTIDNVVGIVYTKDIFKHNKHLQPHFTLMSVLRDAIFLPETTSLERVLTTSLQKRTHMIILADEYGGTAGLITLENVLEELVGNIQDEYDRETPELMKLGENEFLVAGYITTSDIERLFSTELSPFDIRSIGGFIIDRIGHIPFVGEQVQLQGLEFRIEKVVDNAIESVRIKKLPASMEGSAEP